jgi:hypothetical protein
MRPHVPGMSPHIAAAHIDLCQPRLLLPSSWRPACGSSTLLYTDFSLSLIVSAPHISTCLEAGLNVYVCSLLQDTCWVNPQNRDMSNNFCANETIGSREGDLQGGSKEVGGHGHLIRGRHGHSGSGIAGLNEALFISWGHGFSRASECSLTTCIAHQLPKELVTFSLMTRTSHVDECHHSTSQLRKNIQLAVVVQGFRVLL